MNSNKIIRSICYFSRTVDGVAATLSRLADNVQTKGFEVQAQRVCVPWQSAAILRQLDNSILTSIGSVPFERVGDHLETFYARENLFFNLDLTSGLVRDEHAQLLFDIIARNPSRTFNFTYVFNNVPSSPYFPSAHCAREGFAIGLQPTDLSEGCTTLDAWLEKVERVWQELCGIFGDDPEFLGIDSSIAPFGNGKGSLVDFVRRLGMTFSESVTTDLYLRITNFIKNRDPKPVGLCGLMFPCLEDFELAAEYELGNFSIERNVYLSLHSGLGVDTYPIGVDENPKRVLEILSLLRGLAAKYDKPLSARFVSDGKAKIGEKTNFGSRYLKDVVVWKL